jgi:transient receptor potential cation channel subfamily A protein 1
MNFLAAKNGSYEICELLIHTIKHLLFREEYLSLILRKNINQRTAIHEAVRMGNLNVLNLFFRLVDYENRIAICEDYDDELKTSLHYAAAEGRKSVFLRITIELISFSGHFEIVQFLVHQGVNVSSCDMNDSTPLHEAAAYNRYSCVEILLHHQAPINQYDGKHCTPLHRASQNGHWNIVRLLLNSHAEVHRINSDGYNALEVAIINNHRSTVREFLQHQTWAKSLRNAQLQMISERKYEDHSTPLRKLIRYMPNEAEEVFTRCMTKIGNPEDSSYKIIFNYEFLEDQLSIVKWQQDETYRSNSHVYTLRENHPLYLIITYHQYDLLKHPLIDQLIKRKWIEFSRTFFWISFLSYGLFLASFTSMILRVHHPQYYYSLFNASISTVSCETISLNLLRHESFFLTKKNCYDITIKWILFTSTLIHIIKNLLLICIRLKMFFGLSNILELIALILSIIFSHDFYSWQMSIRFRCSFQWQCGAIGILIGWIILSKLISID